MSAARHATPADEPLAVVRYVDVGLVLLALPFVLVAGLPLLGYAVGAVAWIVQRAVTVALERRGRRMDPRRALSLEAAAVFARGWLVALAIIAVGLRASRDGGAMAAATGLAAFTA